jgi:hypothetical protein
MVVLYTTASRPAMGLTLPHIQWVPWARSKGGKQPGREADHLPQSSAELKNGGALPPRHIFTHDN